MSHFESQWSHVYSKPHTSQHQQHIWFASCNADLKAWENSGQAIKATDDAIHEAHRR